MVASVKMWVMWVRVGACDGVIRLGVEALRVVSVEAVASGDVDYGGCDEA